MRFEYECECEHHHDRQGSIRDELEGYSTNIECECGAVYAVSVTMLRPPESNSR